MAPRGPLCCQFGYQFLGLREVFYLDYSTWASRLCGMGLPSSFPLSVACLSVLVDQILWPLEGSFAVNVSDAPTYSKELNICVIAMGDASSE